MDAKNFNIEQLLAMAHSPVQNYAIPGLTSWLIGQPCPKGTMRLFHCSRDHQQAITPHSHRFGFQCWVLEGGVVNRLWREKRRDDDSAGDLFAKTKLDFKGDMGQYELGYQEIQRFAYEDRHFKAGECYSMAADEIHSIYFGRGTRVLFFEGPTVADHSVILEPYVGGQVVPTFKVEPWMFKREKIA